MNKLKLNLILKLKLKKAQLLFIGKTLRLKENSL